MTSGPRGRASTLGGPALQQTLEARRAFADDVLRNPVIAIAMAYCEVLGLRLPRSVIRTALAASSEFPFLGLASLVDAFDGWQVPNVALKASALEELPSPAIVVIEEAGDEGGTARVFSLLLGRSEEDVAMRHPALGEMIVPLEAFLAVWTGHAFVAERDIRAEARFAEERAKEQLEEDEYRKSIRLLPDFLSRAECESLIDLCELSGWFEASGLAADERPGGEKERLSKTRTSDSAVLPLGDRLCDDIRKRAAEVLKVDCQLVEPLQCVRYRPGQQFMAHYDAGRNVRRVYTVLVYLNQNFEGGETHFPEIDVTIQPIKGKALAFRNLDRNGIMIPQAQHAGLPVASGVKYVCNVWIRARGP